MAARVGDRVHVAGLGTGVVREVRNAGRCLVEIKGRAMVVSEGQLAPVSAEGRPGRKRAGSAPAVSDVQVPAAIPTLDLHGFIVEDALHALDEFLNDALLAGAEQARVIHGKSSGRIKAAVHKRLRELPSVQSFRLDPRNPGLTVVSF